MGRCSAYLGLAKALKAPVKSCRKRNSNIWHLTFSSQYKMELMFANTGLVKIHIALPMTIQFHIDLLQVDSLWSQK